MNETIRTWERDGYRLELIDTGATGAYGKTRLSYVFTLEGVTVCQASVRVNASLSPGQQKGRETMTRNIIGCDGDDGQGCRVPHASCICHSKRMGSCPTCSARIVLTGDGRHPCSFCGSPLPASLR
jgi:hypothetical protein